MKRDDYEFGERITQDLQARRAAREILEVPDGATTTQLKKAYRRACLKYHPDRNKQNGDAAWKFAVVNCAYKLLAEDQSCEMLAEQIENWFPAPHHDRFRLDNPWGYFLWWRDKFFEKD